MNHNGQPERNEENSSPSTVSNQVKETGQTIRIKEEEDDSASVDVEAHEGNLLFHFVFKFSVGAQLYKLLTTFPGEGEPRDLSLETRKSPMKENVSLPDESSSSVSQRSSPPLSPRPQFEFSQHRHQILTRFPPILDHHSFMAYSHHINAFPFGHQSLEPPSAHKRLPFDFHPQGYHRQDLFPNLNPNNQSDEQLISSLLCKRQDESVGTALDERRKRNRTFIDPVSEVPRLEAWFSLNTHPSHALILKYTEELNRMPYRQKFPKLEPKNVQFWFKNRRAKSKRLKMAI